MGAEIGVRHPRVEFIVDVRSQCSEKDNGTIDIRRGE